MDIHSLICYVMGYATPWHLSAARSTKTSSRSSTASWQDVSICGRDSKLLDKLCSALGPELRQGGAVALRPKPTPGRPPRFSQSQKRKLLRLLNRGPCAAGYTTDLWTLPRIAKLIEKHFGIRYHPGHVWRVMMNLEWTWQKPQRRATQRDEETIARWKKYEWPSIKKSPKTWGPSRISRRKRVPPHP